MVDFSKNGTTEVVYDGVESIAIHGTPEYVGSKLEDYFHLHVEDIDGIKLLDIHGEGAFEQGDVIIVDELRDPVILAFIDVDDIDDEVYATNSAQHENTDKVDDDRDERNDSIQAILTDTVKAITDAGVPERVIGVASKGFSTLRNGAFSILRGL